MNGIPELVGIVRFEAVYSEIGFTRALSLKRRGKSAQDLSTLPLTLTMFPHFLKCKFAGTTLREPPVKFARGHRRRRRNAHNDYYDCLILQSNRATISKALRYRAKLVCSTVILEERGMTGR